MRNIFLLLYNYILYLWKAHNRLFQVFLCVVFGIVCTNIPSEVFEIYLFILFPFQRHLQCIPPGVHLNNSVRDVIYASKMIGVKPDEIKITKILILDSKSQAGIGLTRKLKRENIKFARIKSDTHFGNIKQIHSILLLFKFEIIVDFSQNDFYKLRGITERETIIIKVRFGNNISIKSINDQKLIIEIPKTVGYLIPSPIQTVNDFLLYEYYQVNVENNITEYIKSMKHEKVKFLSLKLCKEESSYKNVTLNSIEKSSRKLIGLFIEKSIKKGEVFMYANYAANLIFFTLKNLSLFNDRIKINNFNKQITKMFNKRKVFFDFNETLDVPIDIIEFNEFLKNDRSYVSLITTLSDNEKNLFRCGTVLGFYNNIYGKSFYFPVEILIISFFNKSKVTPQDFKSRFPMIRNLRILEIPSNYIEKIQQKHNSKNIFPEFFLRNIGIRRAKGKYVFAFSSDVLPNFHFFRMCNLHSLGKNMYFRSFRKQTKASNLYSKKELKNYFSYKYLDIKVTFLNLKVVKYKLPGYPNLKTYGCGDIQGCHRSIWNAIKGYYEGKEVYHVDSFMSMDIVSLPVPIAMKSIMYHVHIQHKQVSNKTPHLLFKKLANDMNYIFGICSASLHKYSRPHWGGANVSFIEI